MIHQLLASDHIRLRALLEGATLDPSRIDLDAYAQFRRGLLRHIAMEEKVLFPLARERPDPVLLVITKQLHADHAAIGSILVPPPDDALLAELRAILVEHDPLEEDPDGLYAQCERLAGENVAEVVARMQEIPEVRASRHVDGPRIRAHIARMIEVRRSMLSETLRATRR